MTQSSSLDTETRALIAKLNDPFHHEIKRLIEPLLERVRCERKRLNSQVVFEAAEERWNEFGAIMETYFLYSALEDELAEELGI